MVDDTGNTIINKRASHDLQEPLGLDVQAVRPLGDAMHRTLRVEPRFGQLGAASGGCDLRRPGRSARERAGGPTRSVRQLTLKQALGVKRREQRSG